MVSAGVDMAAMSSMPGMMPGMGAQPGQPQDFKKLFLAEKENVLITPHVWDLDDVEERLLVKYGKLDANISKKSSSSSSSPSSSTTTKGKKELSIKDKIKAAQKTGGNAKRR
ncbi:unnamed protein product [Absidia cylindrospora]